MSRILFAGDLAPHCRTYQRFRALQELGHTVEGVTTSPVDYVPGLTRQGFWDKVFIKLDHPLDLTGANRELQSRAASFQPDVVFIERALMIRPETLRRIKAATKGRAFLVSYSEDDMFAPNNQSVYYRQCLPLYDLVYTTKSYNTNPDELPALGARCVRFIDKAYDRTEHRPIELSADDLAAYQADVAFVGTFESDRARQLLLLAERGFDVRVWGNGWQTWVGKHPKLRVENRPVYADDYAKTLRAGKINLCFLRKANRDLQTDRTMEIPACAAFMLAERTAEHQRLFEEGKEAAYFDVSDDEELVSRVGYYLAHEEERRSIAEAGRRRALNSNYSHHDRLTEMLAQAEELRAASARPRAAVHGSSQVLRALNISSHVDLKFGGICGTTPGLSRALQETGRWKVSTVALVEPDEVSPFGPADGDLLMLPRGRVRWLKDANLREQLRAQVAAADVVNIHGLWEEHSLYGAAMARQLGKPYMVSAHGALEAWAVNHGRLKKAVYAALIERRNLVGAHCLRAATTEEVNDYRRYGLSNAHCAVLPYVMDIRFHADTEIFYARYPELRGKRLVLFFSRMHHKKGLDILCKAWKTVSQKFPDAHLVLAGPESPDTHDSLMKLIAELGIAPSLTLTGMVTGEMKWATLKAATCFVLPSYSENFGVAISEAMMMRRPVIVSSACHRPEIAENGAGVEIEPAVEQIIESVIRMLSISGAERDAYGENGARLVQQRYSPEAVGRDTAAVFEWMLKLRNAPPCVSGPQHRAALREELESR